MAPMLRHRLPTILAKQLVALLALELVVRALAGLDLVALPPGGLFGFDQTQQGVFAPAERRLYQPDRNLVMRMRPDFHLEYDRAAVYPDGQATYTVDTEAHGFRTAPFSETKRPGVFRILCLGDSSTFGMNVEAADAYPQVLDRLLETARPGRFEVLNLGTVGFSSRQGIELLRREALQYDPDLVIFAYGSNDRGWHRPLSDDALIRLNQSATGGFVIALDALLDRSYTYRLLRRGSRAVTQRFIGSATFTAGPFRNSLEGIRDAIGEANALVTARGGSLLVLGTLFKETDAGSGLAMGVAATGAPYVNGQELFARARRAHTQGIEADLSLPAASAPDGLLLFRVQAPPATDVVLEAGPTVGELAHVPLHDDGQHGDQRAGDGIYSALVPAPPGRHLIYKYRTRTPGGLAPEFRDNLPLFTFREQSFPADGVGEIDRLGRVHLHSDSAHPDEEGHRLLAEALAAHILEKHNVPTALPAWP